MTLSPGLSSASFSVWESRPGRGLTPKLGRKPGLVVISPCLPWQPLATWSRGLALAVSITGIPFRSYLLHHLPAVPSTPGGPLPHS